MQGGGSVQGVEGVRRVNKQNGVAVVMFKKFPHNNNNNNNKNNHVAATTPQDRSSRCRIWSHGEKLFPYMGTASILGF